MKITRFQNQPYTQPAIRVIGTAMITIAMLFFAGCDTNAPSATGDNNAPSGMQGSLSKVADASFLGSAATFAVLGGTTVTNDGASLITGDLGVSPGTAITGFQPEPINTIEGPGTVTAGLGVVNGTIYAGGPVAAQAHNDAVIAYNYLVAQVPDTTYSGVTQLNGLTFTPGIYSFAPSANLQVNGTVYLDFQGNSDALFIFQLGTTLVTMTGSNVVAINAGNQTCSGSNVYWAVGSSATIDGSQFIGTVIATTTITMTSGANVNGRMLALNGAVTMIADTISVCNGTGGGVIDPPVPCRDFVTGGGWITGTSDGNGKKQDKNNKATFGVSGGIKNGKFWGQLSFSDHGKNGVKVKSTSVTNYLVIDPVTRQIDGIAKVNGKGAFAYTVIVVDNGEPGRYDSFSLVLSNGYTVSGTLQGGNIKLHRKCDDARDGKDKEKYDDKDERDGHNNCDSGGGSH
jgi:hypothetical protein